MRELRLEMLSLYWILLTPVTLLAVTFEFFKRTLDFGEILKRIVLSLFLTWSFEEVCALIAMFSDGIVERMGGMSRFKDVAHELGQNFQKDMPSLVMFRQMLIYLLNFLSYLIALFSFYFTGVASHFVHSVLYVISPLAFLCLIPSATMHIARNIYSGLAMVAVWRILWSILAAVLIEFARVPAAGENFVMSILVNLCIAFSMLFVPFFTRSLLSDGLGGSASAVVGTSTRLASSAVKGLVAKTLKGRNNKQGEQKR
ncbi:MAG: hypothetical protein OXB88_00325 [Bacteriovoracales bacterium]|nr:hypothetical protein [Bacteriovoracales bacterium]